ncbi:MAG: radical SAM protein, partial [Methanomicrobiaceae archaeon]|nr:radical SAM protein [Methanomicrobiaceae archaeon]
MRQVLSDVLGGHRLTEAEAVALLSARNRDVWEIAAAADEMRESRVGDAVTYVRNQNIHVTNICKNLCGFCGFGRSPGSEGAYLDDRDTILRKAALAREREVTEICLLSGVHPDFTVRSYEDMIAWVREAAPGVDIHTASPEEIVYAAGKSGISTREAITRLRDAGLGTLQGTAAEILVDSVRRVICPNKIDTATWVRVIEEAHRL